MGGRGARAELTEVEVLSGGMTSTMLALTDSSQRQSVLRFMSNEPWRSHGAALTAREQAAQRALATTSVPVPRSLALDAAGRTAGVAAHLMTRVLGAPMSDLDGPHLVAMAEMLATIHDAHPPHGFRHFESWAWEAKWVVPSWTEHSDSWQAAFGPGRASTSLHSRIPAPRLRPPQPAVDRRRHHRSRRLGGDLGRARLARRGARRTNLAVAHGPGQAVAFLEAFARLRSEPPHQHWLVMDAVGFLPPPGAAPMFGSSDQLGRLDDWLRRVVSGATGI